MKISNKFHCCHNRNSVITCVEKQIMKLLGTAFSLKNDYRKGHDGACKWKSMEVSENKLGHFFIPNSVLKFHKNK